MAALPNELTQISRQAITTIKKEGGVPYPTKFGEPDGLSTPFTHHIINVDRLNTPNDFTNQMKSYLRGQGVSPEVSKEAANSLRGAAFSPFDDSKNNRAQALTHITGDHRFSTTSHAAEKQSLAQKLIAKLTGTPASGPNRHAEAHYHETAHLYHSTHLAAHADQAYTHAGEPPSTEAYAMSFDMAKTLASGQKHTMQDRLSATKKEDIPRLLATRIPTTTKPGQSPSLTDIHELRAYTTGFIAQKEVLDRWNKAPWTNTDQAIGKVATDVTRHVSPDLRHKQTPENNYAHHTAEQANTIFAHKYSDKGAYFSPHIVVGSDGQSETLQIRPLPTKMLPKDKPLDPDRNPQLKAELQSWSKEFALPRINSAAATFEKPTTTPSDPVQSHLYNLLKQSHDARHTAFDFSPPEQTKPKNQGLSR